MTEKHYKRLIQYIEENCEEGLFILNTEWEKRNIYGGIVKLARVIELRYKDKSKFFRLKSLKDSATMYEATTDYIKEKYL